MRVGRASPHEITVLWDRILPLLKPAFQMETTTHTPEDLVAPLMSGEAQMFLVADEQEIIGLAVTAIEAGSKTRVLSVLHIGGKRLKTWAAEMDKTLTEYGKQMGCMAYESVTNRDAFVKLIPGLKEAGKLYIKRIDI